MNCYYHPDREAKTQCTSCDKNLCEECSISQKDGSSICTRCLALEAAEDTARGIDSRAIEKSRHQDLKATRKHRRRNMRLFAQYGLIIIGLIIVAVQAPKIFTSLEDERPLRHGSYETNSLTDECIGNLWKISKILQQGKLPGNDILCPASKKPYEIIQTDSDVIARSPNPELYGFKEIRVSRLKPVPELVK